MNGTHSIRTILIISTSLVLVLAQFVSGLIQYREQSLMARNQIRAVSEQAVQPLINLASDAINGGNTMILNNKESKSLYGATGVLFLRMEGTSAGAEKTEWSEAIAPQKIRHEFLAKDQDGAKLAQASQEDGLIESQLLYVVHIPLASVKNGGELIAVFSAAALADLKGQVALRVASVTVLIALLGMLPIWWLGRRISQPLQTVVDAAEYVIRHDDFSREVPQNGALETVRVGQALNHLLQKFRTIIADVRQSSQSIADASQEIASGNADLSVRTESQATNLRKTTVAMEAMADIVKKNAQAAGSANQLVGTASEVAIKGGRVVGEVVGTMASITASSNKISDIIGVIDGIAFQTNILALNAAVEAARAGEQGRGFAVVASEVRSLAQRSAEAAKEIKTLIMDSAEKVDAGSKLVDEAGRTMDEVVDAVQRVTTLMGEIAAAGQHQTDDIAQVTSAVEHMDEATRQNATLVQEAAAAAKSLEEQAGRLSHTVSVFRL